MREVLPLSTESQIIVFASQMPQQELGVLAQVLTSQGFTQEPMAERSKGSPVLKFSTRDGLEQIALRLYQDLAVFRLELTGERAVKIGLALSQYFEALRLDSLIEQYESSDNDLEQRVYAILMVLLFPDAEAAFKALSARFFYGASLATQEGLIQGLVFLESADLGPLLERLEKEALDPHILALLRKAIDALSERGLIRESVASIKAKLKQRVAEHPQAVLDELDRYEEGQGGLVELRALRARALLLLGRSTEASDLLTQLSPNDVDAAEAYLLRALLREAAGFLVEAMQDIQLSLVCDPHQPEAQSIFARLQVLGDAQTRSNADKIAQLTIALSERPNDANALIQRAELLYLEARYEEALKDLQQGQGLASNDPRLARLFGEVYLALGYYGSALEEAVMARQHHVPSLALEAWTLKPRVYLALDMPEAALASLRDFPADLQKRQAYFFLLGLCLESLGQGKAAAATYAQLDPSALPMLAEAYPLIVYRPFELLAHLGLRLCPSEKPSSVLGKEIVDPDFKRCQHCGALGLRRRSQCRQCASKDFF